MVEKHDGRGELEGNKDGGNVIKYRKPDSKHEINTEKNRDYVWWLI